MPAEEAMVLYLLLHHAFLLWELQTVRIPSQCRPLTLGAEPPESLEDTLSSNGVSGNFRETGSL